MLTKHQKSLQPSMTCGAFKRAARRHRLAIPGMVASLLVLGAPVQAEEEPPLGQINENFRVLGELRGRLEGFDFFQPAPNPAKGVTGNENDYVFGALRARLGVAMTTPWADGLVQ
ncbi:hypothetical protein, partial [Methylomagnum sp.]